MSNELNLQLNPSYQSGLTLEAVIKTKDGDVQGDPVALEEITNTAYYTGDMPTGLLANEYVINFFNGEDLVGYGYINWDGTKEITLNNVNSSLQTRLSRVVVGKLTANISKRELEGKLSKPVITGKIKKTGGV